MSNTDRPTKEMKMYALEEMSRLLRNMQHRPIECYSEKIRGQEKVFYLGKNFIDKLIKSLEEQYNE